MKVTTASGRKSTADCHLLVVSADRSVKAFHYRAMDTPLTVSVVCQSPPSAPSCTLHLPPPHHMLSASAHHNASAPTNSPGSSETLSRQLLPPVWSGPALVGFGNAAVSVGYGAVENAYQQLGRGR